MSPPATGGLALREFHPFEAAGEHFLYMVPSAGVFHVDTPSWEVLRTLEGQPMSAADLTTALADRYRAHEVANAIQELQEIRAIGDVRLPPAGYLPVIPPQDFPLTTMVLNVTNKCNLACTYCYEYGEDKIVDTDFGAKPKFMSEETARESVDFMFRESGQQSGRQFDLLRRGDAPQFQGAAKNAHLCAEQAVILGKEVQFSLTTNATLLRPEIIEWLVDNQVGVTISIDGPKESQDQFRVFNNGMGSYELVLPKIKELLKRHTAHLIGARVTLTKQNLDVMKIFRHLTEDLGFWSVGFAPVTTADGRDYAIEGDGFSSMLAQFAELAEEFKEAALENRHHGFSNLNETLEEIHKGMSKAFPCGAGLGLMGVATDAMWRCAIVSPARTSTRSGRCRTEWTGKSSLASWRCITLRTRRTAIHVGLAHCAPEGCYHEANTRYGTTAQPNLHYCDWIRSWTDTCLRVYGEIATHNPNFLRQYDTPAPVPA